MILLNKNMLVYKQMMYILYIYYGEINHKIFMKQNMEISKREIIFNSVNYNILMKKKFDPNFLSALNSFIELKPEFFNKDKKMIYTDEKMFDKLSYNLLLLENHIKNNLFRLDGKITNLKFLYKNISDFTVHNNKQIILLSEIDLYKYLFINKNKSKRLIYYDIIPIDSIIIEPILIYLNNKIYFIQFVSDNDKNRAINVMTIWNEERINMGYFITNNNLYVDYNVIELEKHTKKILTDNYLNNYILVFDETKYAAILALE